MSISRFSNNSIKHSIAAVCSDMDNTFVRTEHLSAQAVNNTLGHLGKKCLTPEQIHKTLYGRSWLGFVSELQKIYANLSIDEFQKAYYHDYTHLVKQEGNNILIKEAVEFLKYIGNKVPLAIVSGSPTEDIERYCGMAGLTTCVKYMIGDDKYEIGKPDPSCYLIAAKLLGIEPKYCLGVEDSKPGIDALNLAGMISMGVRAHSYCDLTSADIIVDSLMIDNVAQYINIEPR